MNPTDFLALYQQLGLRPDSNIDELKLAYRRRVADLHPDRPRNTQGRSAEVAGEHLRQLTALYGSATAFHRRHGRLPGAGVGYRPIPPAPSAPAAAIPVRRSVRGVAFISALVLAVGIGGWWWFGSADDEAAGGGDEASPTVATGDRAGQIQVDAPPFRLELGLSRNDVLEIEKAPIAQGEDRWDYGPSWIAFERGKVSDWYSSPLRPLRYATTHPLSRGGDDATPRN